jgi:t-SNARE complex subunit (syntaxin)
MEQRNVDNWIARQQDGPRRSVRQNRRDTIRQWMLVAVVACVVMAVMVALGGA